MVITIIVSMSSFLIYQTPKVFKTRINSSLINYENYQAGRGDYNAIIRCLKMWIDSVKFFIESPFVGIVLSDFESHISALVSKGELRPRANYGHAHSIYFNTLATAGLVGFLGLMLFVLWLSLTFFLRLWCNADSDESRILFACRDCINHFFYGFWFNRHMVISKSTSKNLSDNNGVIDKQYNVHI